MSTIENVILAHMVHNEAYAKKIAPHLKPEYFKDASQQILCQQILEYVDKYRVPPTPTALQIAASSLKMNEDVAKAFMKHLEDLAPRPEPQSAEWLLATTESFCRDKAVYNALFESISILDASTDTNNKKSKVSPDAIPEIMRRALAVSFDDSVGHDYVDDVERRYDLMHSQEQRLPFQIDVMNEITNGGLPRKTLGVCIAPPGGGKSIFLCDYAAYLLKQNYNVLYITMELAEERVAERIDANLLNIKINDLFKLSLETYKKKVADVRNRVKGKLFIKEFPSGEGSAAGFEAVLAELKIKKNFVPDAIMVDYLGICRPNAYSASKTQMNSYEKYGTVAVELRALAKRYNAAVMTAAQVQRVSYKDSDADMGNIAESSAINNTADFMFFLFQDEQMEQLGEVLGKIWKNRLGPKGKIRRFIMGLDLEHMRFYNMEDKAQPKTLNIADKTATTFKPPGVGDEDDAPFDPLPTATGKTGGKTFDWT